MSSYRPNIPGSIPDFSPRRFGPQDHADDEQKITNKDKDKNPFQPILSGDTVSSGQQQKGEAFDWPQKAATGGNANSEERGGAPPSKVSLKENNMDAPEHEALYARGLEMRKRVVGEDYVAGALEKGSTDFLRPLQQFATESAWGTIWTRPGLELKTRSLLNLVMLTALGKWIELGTHVRGAVRNGASEVEIREALLQASAYCGMPAGLEAFRVADRVLGEMESRGELVRE